jgi:RNA polymerase sigma-70 factor (ECF subfamily)
VNEPKTISETELFQRAMAGDEEAFRALYEKLKRPIFRYAFYMTNSRSAAEEVTQDVFMMLLRQGNRFDSSQGDLGAFTFGLARNLVRRAARRDRNYRAPFDGSQSEIEAPAPESLTGDLIRGQRVASVRQAIAKLPDHYRQAVVLCDLCELSYAKAAQRLGCAVGTIRSRLNRAHALLAEKLKLLEPERELRDAGAEGCLT